MQEARKISLTDCQSIELSNHIPYASVEFLRKR